MKTLELNKMEKLQGGGGFWTAFTCTLTVIAGAAIVAGTGGTGAIVGYYVAGAGCGGLIGEGLATGSLE